MKNFSLRSMLWLVFGFSIFMLWQNWQIQNAPIKSSVETIVQTSTTMPSNNVISAPKSVEGAVPQGKKIILQNDVLKLEINTEGGVIQFAQLLKFNGTDKKDEKIVLLNTFGKDIYVAQSGLSDASLGLNHKTKFTSNINQAVMKEADDSISVILTASNNGITLRKTYALKRGSYAVDVINEVENQSSVAISPIVYLSITRDPSQMGNSNFYSTYTGPVIHNEVNKFKKITFEDIAKDDNKTNVADRYSDKADNGWVAMVQHYFVSAWAVNDKIERTFYTRAGDKSAPVTTYSVGELFSLGIIEPATKKQLNSQFYVGPQDSKILDTVAPGLSLSVDYGWATMIAKPLHWFLTFLHQFLGNWGWAIIVMTLLVKLALFPLTAASFKSMAKMKLLAPKLKALQEQHGDDKMKLNQSMMALYKDEKVNPAGGCLPMLLQMPIFISFYYVLQAAIEMRGAPWLGWIRDLSAPDPLYILPALMMLTMFIQTKLNPKPADPMQAKMMLFMPLLFGVTFFFFPSGLVLYWVVSNIFSIVQQHIMNKNFGINDSLLPSKSDLL